MTAVALSERTEFANYVYDSEHTVDVLITLQAEKREQDVNRAAVCLSTTIDKSGSMKERLPLVKQTMTFLLLQLMDEDKLGIVTYDTNVNIILCSFLKFYGTGERNTAFECYGCRRKAKK